MVSNSVTFCVSQDLDVPFRLKIVSLEGQKPLLKASQRILNPDLTLKSSNVYPNSDLLVSVQIFNKLSNRNLTLPVYSPFKSFRNNTRKWNQWIKLPLKIKQLDNNSMLRIVLWEFDGNKKVIFSQLETEIFNSVDYSLKRGFESIKFQYNDNPINLLEKSVVHQLDDVQLELLNKYYQNELLKIDWLDKISLKKIEKQREKRNWPINTFVLNIEFPIFEIPVVYTDSLNLNVQDKIPTLQNYELLNDGMEKTKAQNKLDTELKNTTFTNKNISNISNDSENPDRKTRLNSTQKFYDPDQFNVDPIEEKYRRLERASKRSNLDKEVKPDTKKRNYLNRIINYPPGTRLTAHEKGSIWKYRYYLINNKKALTKLLQSTNLTEEPERIEVLELMDIWAEIDIGDAIELLGSVYRNITVRAYAVNRLKKASDKELELYLLQLVQAVCFEGASTFSDRSNSEFMMVNSNIGAMADDDDDDELIQENISRTVTEHNRAIIISPLAEFLIRRAIKNFRLGNFFYWYLRSEAVDNPFLNKIIDSYCSRLPRDRLQVLKRQVTFDNVLRDICEEVKRLKDTTIKKRELLRHLLTSRLKNDTMSHEIILPLNPDIHIIDVDIENCSVFKSSLSPLKISFKTTNDTSYTLMYKVGDDLRQDQLIVQIITLMNELLKNENVDLKLLPYSILATGPKEGAIQFIPNDTMTVILSKYHGILPYFREFHPDLNEELGVEDWIMDNFVKSCAGYCVITYILGVGDRHLDNLLITRDGHFFHADFGYILGQDPKPFPPLMKLPPQIIDAFGGAESSNYNKFRSYCFVAYSILRRNAGLILNLFELMKTSNIPDIRIDPDGSVSKVKERFNLDMSEEEATIHFQQLINDSVNALMPIVIDHLHNLAQYWRA
ncbi:hypothetical protein TBLA_0H00850 [Henningerozyma blattae CBS 6284]|uniref:Phosphatidylinositol 3-kinase VPS34 n=1 Tax=Henningerozyma blattae (strain ATCC 34711 / CBS 6284 / DSM 70876 / NBRC 10599 / NRRL Y-10934 / UCD 77-7) TaxID=1071380 RepID=I2H7M2_HENB6|nr:hypothetical protein TBLA_0H00850 [Tetrapisispora blattae CBS 6284]CCH62374.1 hypothetical protein TBLA_0H00850 [Tetrapisispora blattae CBS 6284]